MKSLLTNLQTLTGRRTARLVALLFAGLVLAASVSFGRRGVSADSLAKFGMTGQSRVGKLLDLFPLDHVVDGIGAAPC